jgi:serine/threonine-protein kinase
MGAERGGSDPRHGRAVATAEAPLPAGAVVGGYRLERLLARGASGPLYVARRPADTLPRAVKILALSPGLPDEQRQQVQARFLREAELLRQLSHAAIVDVHAAGVEAGTAYLVMTLLPGSDLRRYLPSARRLPEPLLLTLAADVADALAHAHARGIVHRDVKPANLVFDPASRRVWLTDFGAARLQDAQRTRTGLIVGTPAFMPPEQLSGAPPGAPGDIYALAATVFQLLSGRLPHEGDTMGALLQSMARGSALGLRTVRNDLPEALDALLAQALHRDPSARPGAAALARALREIAATLA